MEHYAVQKLTFMATDLTVLCGVRQDLPAVCHDAEVRMALDLGVR